MARWLDNLFDFYSDPFGTKAAESRLQELGDKAMSRDVGEPYRQAGELYGQINMQDLLGQSREQAGGINEGLLEALSKIFDSARRDISGQGTSTKQFTREQLSAGNITGRGASNLVSQSQIAQNKGLTNLAQQQGLQAVNIERGTILDLLNKNLGLSQFQTQGQAQSLLGAGQAENQQFNDYLDLQGASALITPQMRSSVLQSYTNSMGSIAEILPFLLGGA